MGARGTLVQSGRDRGLVPGGRDLLLELLAAGGPAGGEGPAAAVLRRVWAPPLADGVEIDRLGTVLAFRAGRGTGPRPAVLLAAHLDTVGLQVTRLLPGGFLRAAPVGGLHARALLGREVIVEGRRPVPAVAATLPPHLLPVRRGLPPFAALALDTGCSDRDLGRTVRPGDFGRFRPEPLRLIGEGIAGAGLDNRAGVAALHEALLGLAALPAAADVWLAANVQEEVGLRGIGAVARRIRPAAALVVDAGFAVQPGAEGDRAMHPGRGPAVAVGPGFDPAIAETVEREAARLEVPLQREVREDAAGTDVWALQAAAGGIPAGLLSIPVRSMHGAAETCAYDDVAAAGSLLRAFAAAVTPAWLRDRALPRGAAERP